MDFSAPPGTRRVFQPATGQCRPLLHAQPAQTRATHGLLPDDRHLKSITVVAYAQVELRRFLAQLHLHCFRLGVAHH